MITLNRQVLLLHFIDKWRQKAEALHLLIWVNTKRKSVHTLQQAPISELYDMDPRFMPLVLASSRTSNAASNLPECPATSISALINICTNKGNLSSFKFNYLSYQKNIRKLSKKFQWPGCDLMLIKCCKDGDRYWCITLWFQQQGWEAWFWR